MNQLPPPTADAPGTPAPGSSRAGAAGGWWAGGLRRVAGLLGRACARPTVVLGATAVGVLGMAGLAQAVVFAGVRPAAGPLLDMAWGAALASLSVAWPVAILGGVVAGLRGLRDDGAWDGLASLGVRGRLVGVALAGWVAAGGAGYLLVGHYGEPWGRAGLRDARAVAGSALAPREGRTVPIGPASAAVEDGRLLVAGGGWFGGADAWSMEAAQGALVVDAVGLELVRPEDGTRIRAGRATIPVGLGPGPRVSAGERDTPSLVRWLAAAEGPRAYERWILQKRTVLPVGLVLLGLAAVPLALGRPGRGRVDPRRWPPLAIVAALLLPQWATVRLLDGVVASWGVPAATAALLAGLGALAAAAWAAWDER